MAEFAQAPATLVLDDLVRVYFSCRPAQDERASTSATLRGLTSTGRTSPASSPSRTGRSWSLGASARSTSSGHTRVRDPRRDGRARLLRRLDPLRIGPLRRRHRKRPERRRRANVREARRWPVLGRSPDEPFVVSGPKIRRFGDAWVLFYIAGRTWKVAAGRPEPVYRIRMANSVNGIDWTRHNADLVEPRLEADEAQASPERDLRGRHLPHVLLLSTERGLPQPTERLPHRVCLEPDLVTWTRDDARAGIDVSGEGWDAEMLSYPHVFELDGRTYLAYLGNGVGRRGFGLAVLDGSLSPTEA